MNGLVMAAQLIFGLAILVTLHELGHFLAARAFGIRVEKFYLFFDAWGFKFFKFKRGDTEYGLGWLPLGGYVKISGMIDESMDKEAMKLPPEPWEFRSKPAWQRLIVMIGGVTMNVLLGIFIYTASLLHYDKEYLANKDVNDGIFAFELAEKLGLQTGDKITAINGKPFERFEELLSSKVIFGCDLTVDRAGQTVHVIVPADFYFDVTKSGKGFFLSTNQTSLIIDSTVAGKPGAAAGLLKDDKVITVNEKRTASPDGARKIIKENTGKAVSIVVLRGADTLQFQPLVSDSGIIGVYFKMDLGKYPMTAYSFGTALSIGTADAFEAIIGNIKGLKQIFAGKAKASDSLQGPIGIATIYGSVWDWRWFWKITGLLSMILAFMNILPIPALDGGHVVFLVIEAVTKRKFSDKFMERAQVTGMVILLALMAFTIGNDIWKHVIN
ncbi:MAG: RIP metalloprotease RseP [Bacteroidetes bacterium]|nr:RIP metalloprotease RseP [Bacteroidota bacterium]